MRFDFTLISTFLSASAVLAAHIPEHRSSQFLDVVEKRTSATSDSAEASTFAGAVLYTSIPTLQSVSSIITIPFVWPTLANGTTDWGVGIWVGLDGGPDKHCGAVFSAGFTCIASLTGQLSYTAGTYWYPGSLTTLPNFEVSYGDQVNVTVSVSDQTTGIAMFEKFGTNEAVSISHTFNNQPSLCQLSAGWLVSSVPSYELAHFGFVPFTNPIVYAGDQNFTAGGSSVYNIVTGDGLPLTTVEAYGNMIRVIENYVL